MLKIKRIVDLIWHISPGWMVIHAVVMLIQSILPLTLIYIIKLVIDSIALSINAINKSQFIGHVTFLLTIATLISLLNNFNAVAVKISLETLSQRITDYMQVILFRKSIEIDLESHESPKYQNILERAKWESPYQPSKILTGACHF